MSGASLAGEVEAICRSGVSDRSVLSVCFGESGRSVLSMCFGGSGRSVLSVCFGESDRSVLSICMVVMISNGFVVSIFN